MYLSKHFVHGDMSNLLVSKNRYQLVYLRMGVYVNDNRNSETSPEIWRPKFRKQTGAREASQQQGPQPKATQNPCEELLPVAEESWRPQLHICGHGPCPEADP